uniref:CSON000725 protein n=1 Tax=Culicoides sonorensis TaxID=179676 RepID=A0A336KWG4_CULSO
MSQQICRVCLKVSPEQVNLRNTFYKNGVSFIDVFVECTGISLNEDKILCIQCEHRLIEAYEFRVEALESEELWKKIKTEPVEDESDYVNVQCDIKVEELAILPLSQRSVRSNKSHCRFCLQTMSGEIRRKHEQEHIKKNGGLECHHCSKKYGDRKRISSHLKYLHFSKKFDSNKPRYTCNVCGKEISDYNSLRRHQMEHKDKKPKPREKAVCPICGESYLLLRKHMRLVHLNTTVRYCDMCGRGFKTRETLVNHIKFKHLNIREAECPVCKRLFHTKGEVNTHIKAIHSTPQKVKCKICGSEVKSEKNLRHHMKNHTANLDFSCVICGARFKSKQLLTCHMRVHSDARNYACDFCPSKFKRPHDLTIHKRKHTGEMFTCEKCPELKFLHNTSLRQHIENVHMGVRFRCDTCGKDYSNTAHLRYHQRLHNHDKNMWTKVIPSMIENS